MNLATAPDRAQRATRKGAATLHHHVSYELAYGTHHDQQHRERGERALSILEDRFPGIAEEAANVTDPPQLSTRAKAEFERSTGSEDHGGDDHRPFSERYPQEYRRVRQLASERQREREQGPRSAGRTARRASQAMGDIGTGGGWSTTIGDAFVWAAGLSIFYLVITKAAATGKLALGASNVVRALVSPHVDPLNPKGIA